MTLKIEKYAQDFRIEEFRRNFSKGNLIFNHRNIENAFKAGVKFSYRWIPVEEERPEPGLIVLIKRPNYHLAFFDGLRWSDINSGFLSGVTHWRNLDLK